MSVRTVFVGGGTPTLLPDDLLARLLETIAGLVSVERLEEFTVEANPATVDDAKARLLVRAGVTRVSMGAQSFKTAELATLERLHSPEDIAPSVATLRRNGIGQVNLDLIFGIPGQTKASWLDSLRRAIDLGPDHIACYGLTYEPATRLTAMRNTGRLAPCDEDVEAEMFVSTVDTLEAAGYRQYEISNYAKPGCESRHNLVYWRNEPYIGVGPSAAGCTPSEPRAFTHAARRYKNVADVTGYVRMMDECGCAEVESELIEGETLMLEMILMQLRLNEGLSIADFRGWTGVDPVVLFGDTLLRLVKQSLLTVTDARIALTRSGRLVANRVMGALAAETGRTIEVTTTPAIPSPLSLFTQAH
jgi:oxygen-independent coproporphyrinogen-3 oxidase